MHLRERLLVYQPPGLDPTLAQAALDAGTTPLVDATHPSGEQQFRALPEGRAALRVPLDAEPVPTARLAVLAPRRLDPRHTPELEAAVAAWHHVGVPVACEVRTREEGRCAEEAGVDLLVARGAEGPGRVSERSNLVLLGALDELDTPIIAWGGAGPNATGGLFVHAEHVVLDAQLALLPEAGLPEAWHAALQVFDGTDVRTLGTTVDEPFNAFARVAEEHVHELHEREHAATEQGERARREELRREIDARRSGFDAPPGEGLHPLGHDTAHATWFARHGSLEAALDALEARLAEQIDDFPLREDGPLARTHGTRYPVVQGAMANVSEVPAFAEAVAEAGALPFLAFAALRPEWAEETLEGTIEVLGEDQAFGCGIIGLDVNAEKREAHLSLIREHQPPYALIAAGTAEQALEVEQAGVDTYLHTPSQGLVEQAIELGLSHVVVEGNECGGHIGKLPSLVLWDLALQAVEDADPTKPVNLLLAGGISDEATAAVAGTLAAATPKARVGALMGTAYLATREIVETGAITPAYQRLVLAARRTAVTGDTVGIRARSAPTPFTDEVQDLEHELVREGAELDRRKEVLEDANLGATRIAARGLRRGEDGQYHEIPTEEQLHEGNYLMGQGAELLEARTTLDELHQRVTEDAHERARAAGERLSRSAELPRREPAPRPESSDGPEGAIAVVGLGCVFPDAPDVDTFWSNVLDRRVSIGQLPEDRWPIDAATHLDPDRADGTYTLLGAFVDDEAVGFDPIEHRIPPAVADQMDDSQRWAITASIEALEDAGLDQVEDRDRWAVVLGNALGGEQRAWTLRRLGLHEAMDALPADATQARERLQGLLDVLPPITEDTMPGELSNIIASRVCHVLDIGGPARTVDAACASSLAALDEAVSLLREGTVDVALTGGVDRSMDPDAYVKFSAIGALSREGSFPFDERASGFVMGEGCGILALKRLEDAIEDGDRLYAVVEGVGSSSDGRGKGITAPNPSGQQRAIQNALDDAGWDPSTITLVEAHGTGTPVGDPTEVQTLEQVLGDRDPGSVGLGSVKSNIGHLKAAAGAAGLIKTVLAIHEGVQPPTVIEEPTSEVDWAQSPLRPVTEAEPWTDDLRRAGVSAFGFGGTNSHVLLAAPPSAPVPDETSAAGSEPTARGLEVASGTDREALLAQVDADPSTWTFDPEDPIRLATAGSADPDTVRAVLEGELPPELALSKGVYLARGEAGELGLVFPGQGSQYPGMLLDLAEHHDAAQEVLATADEVLTPLLGERLSELLALEGEEGKRALTPTEVCQPAVLACDVAVLRVLEEQGVEPDVVAGHSLGEYAALVAAEVLTFEDALRAVSARGREMADVEVDDPGGLMALRAGLEEVEPLVDGLDAWPANVNAPEQTVVAATTPALDTLEDRAEQAGIQASQLPVSAAFHSPIVAPATEPLRRVLEDVPVDPPRIPVISNVTAEPYPEDPGAIRDLLAEQVASPVRWTETMQVLDDRGVDVIVEAGPKRVLASLGRANLPHIPIVPTCDPRTEDPPRLTPARLALAAHGHLPVKRPEPPAVEDRSAGPTREVQPVAASTEASDPVQAVVTGVSLGLPGLGDPFDPDGVDRMLDGENRIQDVPTAERARMASMGVTRLVKDEDSGPRLEEIDGPDEVVKLAGRVTDVDLGAYQADEDWLEHADPTARLAVAAALEALTDARIPLVRETRETSTGTELAGGWVLPDPIQGETGVILASAFPGDASLVDIVQANGAGATDGTPQTGTPSAGGDLTGYLADLLPHLEDRDARQAALDLLLDHAGGQSTVPRTNGDQAPTTVEEASPGDDAAFPRDFLFRALGMGHAQVAQLLRARGPNLQINAACASTTAALALAQDWIEQGRCERVLVLGADIAGNEELLPWIGAGFLAAGAASTEADVEQAALPFDERRHGMLIGSGAVGLVVETAQAAEDRGVTPLAKLAATHVSNSAFHGSRLDAEHVAEETRAFLDRVRGELDVTRDELARDLVFVSHEPATPPRGGSAEAEVDALRAALGDAVSDVLVSNTKGLTGHAMGAGIEDGMAVEALRRGRAPPVANLQQPDPAFSDITFSGAGETDRRYAMRFAAGFGSQLALALFERGGPQPGTLDEARFSDWVETVCGEQVTVEHRSRLLRAVEIDEASGADESPAEGAARNGHAPETPEPAPQATGETGGASPEEVQALLTELVSQRTGYPEDVIEPEMDLEADLGVDTVKQAEVLAEARKALDIGPIEDLRLADVPTLEAAARTLAEHAGAPEAAPQAIDDGTPADAPAAMAQPSSDQSKDPEPEAGPEGEVDAVVELLTELVSQRTGYPEDVIEPEMDLEADLGVDTVKQAEVLAEARKALDIGPIEDLRLADVPTLEAAAETLAAHTGATPAGEAGAQAAKDDRPADDEEGDAPTIGVRSVRWAPSVPAARWDASPGVAVEGSAPTGLREALEGLDARLGVEAPDLVVHTVSDGSGDPDRLVELLETLQGVPEGARCVLLAPAEAPAARGLAALAATLTAEDRPTRAVLVEPGTPMERVAREVLADTTESVRLSKRDRRTQQLAPSPQALDLELEDGDVVLAPGGLGAAVVPCLERICQDRSLRLVVLGRSPAEPVDLDPDDPEDVQRLRERLLSEAEDATPAEVEAQVQARVKQARRAQALDRLRQAASGVLYERVDATDPDHLEAVVAGMREQGLEPALVVHGTGVERSRAFEDKDASEMRTVLSAKLAPVAELVERLPDAHHVAFGSIAGVLGNPGQADYALANGALAGLLGPVDGTVLHWTAWDAAGGMADDDTVRTVLEERGVAFLDPDRGAELFARYAGTPGVHAVTDETPGTPLTPTSSGGVLALTGEEAFLEDHRVGSRPLLPGVRHLEAMAETAHSRGRPASGFEQVRFERPLWIDGPTEVEIEIDDGVARTTRDDRTHAAARLTDQPSVKPVEAPDPPSSFDVDRDAIYERFFHGPSFQVLEGASVQADGERVIARARLDAGGASGWALALEACLQAAGLPAALEGTSALPAGVEAVQRRRDPVTGDALVVVDRVGEDAVGSTWDGTVFVDGEPVLVARAMRLQRTDALGGPQDALLDLADETGATIRADTVQPHEPRDPRAKRSAEHEAGRRVATRTLREVHGREIELAGGEGEPPTPVDAPGGVSITHGHGLAIAAVHPERERVGVDVERVQARSEAWREDVFTAAERELLVGIDDLEAAEAATLGWTLKEAASKVAGTGFEEAYEAFEIQEVGDGTATVATPEGSVEASWRVSGELVVSVAVEQR